MCPIKNAPCAKSHYITFTCHKKHLRLIHGSLWRNANVSVTLSKDRACADPLCITHLWGDRTPAAAACLV